MKVCFRGHLGTPRCHPQSGVLNGLELLEVGLRDGRAPDLAAVFQNWASDGLVGGGDRLIVLTPRGASLWDCRTDDL